MLGRELGESGDVIVGAGGEVGCSVGKTAPGCVAASDGASVLVVDVVVEKVDVLDVDVDVKEVVDVDVDVDEVAVEMEELKLLNFSLTKMACFFFCSGEDGVGREPKSEAILSRFGSKLAVIAGGDSKDCSGGIGGCWRTGGDRGGGGEKKRGDAGGRVSVDCPLLSESRFGSRLRSRVGRVV